MTPADSTEVAVDLSAERRLAGANLTVALVALFGGVTVGLLQALEHAGVNLYPALVARDPLLLPWAHPARRPERARLHDVLHLRVRAAPRRARLRTAAVEPTRLAWGTFWLMVAGLILAAIPLVGNAASVMFTFYPPLKAHWAFYVGLTLVVVGTWLVTLNLALTLRAWRARHPGQRTPLAGFMAMVTFAMWSIASLGIAAEMLFLLIPWSVGLLSGTDALLARALFWFTGHPIVYFWLLPAYMSWYTLVPRQAGGKLFSDPLARTSFILFLVLSTPLGFHHQYADPGIHHGLEAGPRVPDLRRLLPEPAHVLQRRRLPGERGPRARRPGLGGLVRQAALGRPVGGRAGPGHAPVRLRRGRRPHQRLLQPEPGRPQHGLDSGPSPPDRGHGRDPVVHGHHLLADPRPPGPRPVEPPPGPRPGVALVRGDGGLLARAAQSRPLGRAAAHHAGRGSVHAAGVALGSHVGRDRRQRPVPERPSLLPQHRGHARVVARPSARDAGFRGGALRPGSCAGRPGSLAAVARRRGAADPHRLRPVASRIWSSPPRSTRRASGSGDRDPQGHAIGAIEAAS